MKKIIEGFKFLYNVKSLLYAQFITDVNNIAPVNETSPKPDA